MNIKISSDSSCDLPQALIAKYDIPLIPFPIIKGKETFFDGVDITPEDIFAYAEQTGDLCSTAAINVDSYRALFKKLSGQYDAVIHVCIGSSFSSCYQNACVAAREFPNVYIVDSQNLTTGQGFVVLEACKMAENCTDAAVLCEALRRFTSRVETSFILDRLDFMVKGGRCSSIVALGANLMKLKPCISVIDGKMVVGKKYRGTYTKCIMAYAKDHLGEQNDIVWDTLFLTYSGISDEAMQTAREAIAQYGSRSSRVLEAKAGCTISCHCGPGAFAVVYVRK